MRLGVALCALLGVGPSLPVRADPAHAGLRAELGAEYDSNANRVEHVEGDTSPRPIVGSPLGRLVLAGDFAATLGARHSVALTAGLAGKYFTRTPDENVVVADATGTWNVRAGERTTLGLAGAYYEAFQRRSPDERDFRSVSPTLRLAQGIGETGLLSAGVGYRWLTYWPDRQFDFTGPGAFASYRHLFPGQSGDADWEVSGGGSAELRRFAGTRCTADQCPGPAGAGTRQDQFWTIHLEATRTGAFLAGGGLAGHANTSNSYGEPLLRALAHLRAVVLLPADLSLSARLEFVLARYLDGLPLVRNPITLQPTVSIEDESRSAMRAELVRPLGSHADVGLRYTLYTNEVGASQVHYLRQTALFFVAVVAER
jgi:hypothetical protein